MAIVPAPGLQDVGLGIRALRPFRELCSYYVGVKVFAAAIIPGGGLFQSRVVGDRFSFALDALLHLFFFLQNFFAAWATVLQIFFAEAFDLRCAGAWINSNFVTKCLQFFG